LVQFVQGYPRAVGVYSQGYVSAGLLGQVTDQKKVPVVIVGVDCLIDAAYFDGNVQFFLDFPYKAFFRRLALF
jgi:hypothetical protein